MNIIKTLLLTAALLALAGCMASDEQKLTDGSGTLRLLATDAPFNYGSVSSAKITINKIELRSEDSEERAVQVLGEKVTLDLMQLKNGIVSTLSELEIPAGEYDQIRIYIEDADIHLKDGTHYELTVPSAAKSGLKVFVDPAIKVSSRVSTDLLLDFDLSRSFVPQGTAGSITGFHFKPVVRAVNLSTSGSLFGKAHSDSLTAADTSDDLPAADAIVTVLKDQEIVGTAVTGTDGYYKIMGIEEGIYSLAVSAEGHASLEIHNISIEAANETQENLTLEMQAP